MRLDQCGKTDVSEPISIVYSSGKGASAEIETLFIGLVSISVQSWGAIVTSVLLVIKEFSASA